MESDYNFHKVWLADILSVFDAFGTARIKVLTYLLKIMRTEDNTISGSYREFSKDSGISYPVVAVTLKELIEANVIKKIRTGTYQFNPDLIIKGNTDKRRNLLIRYQYPDELTVEPNEKNQVIEGVVEKLHQNNLIDILNNKYQITINVAKNIIDKYEVKRIEGVMRKIDRLTKINAFKVDTQGKRTQYFLECIEKNLTE